MAFVRGDKMDMENVGRREFFKYMGALGLGVISFSSQLSGVGLLKNAWASMEDKEDFPGRTRTVSYIWRDKSKPWDGVTEYYAVESDRDKTPRILELPLDDGKVWKTRDKYWKWPTTDEIAPPDVIKKLLHPRGAKGLQEEWNEVIGFRAPEKVGKIAPEIKPGMIINGSNYKQYPSLKELMPSDIYARLDPKSYLPFPQIEIVPTRSIYPSKMWTAYTRQHSKGCKIDKDGVSLNGWVAGTPFPRPKKGVELAWNHDKVDIVGDCLRFAPMYWDLYGSDGSYERTYHFNLWYFRATGRTHIDPMPTYGDNRDGIFEWMVNYFSYPQDIKGMTLFRVHYLDTRKPDTMKAYIPSMRRVRKMSGTDLFDPLMGSDMIWEDYRSYWQKLSPTIFPNEYKLLDFREYLLPSTAPYGYVRHYPRLGRDYFCFERRPVYVLEIKSKDPSYVYGKRILYLDAETFTLLHIQNYDQEGRLWRTWMKNIVCEPETGVIHEDVTNIIDHISQHATTLHFTPSCCCKWITPSLPGRYFAGRAR